MRTNDSRTPVSGFRIIVVTAVAIWIGAYGVSGASQGQGLAWHGNAPAYLALGDSYVYGSNESGRDPLNDNFSVGYADYLHQVLDRPLVNSGCPGETTTSFLSGDPLDSPRCQSFKDAGLMHVDYTGAQMEFAENYLTTHNRVSLVTVQLGGNDFQNFAAACKGKSSCILAGFGAFLDGLAVNFDAILSRIRATEYTGPIIFVQYPATNYNSSTAQLQVALYAYLNPVLLAYGGEQAPVFETFRTAVEAWGGDSCAAGLLITNPDGTCNIHPTEAGHRLIASIIAGMVPAPTGKQ